MSWLVDALNIINTNNWLAATEISLIEQYQADHVDEFIATKSIETLNIIKLYIF